MMLRRLFYVIILFSHGLDAALRPMLSASLLSSRSPVFVVLPGFGNNDKDYTSDISLDGNIIQYSLVSNLQSRGYWAEVVPMARWQWAWSVLQGLFSIDWYRRECKPQVLFKFYFDAVGKKVIEVHRKYPQSKIVLLCHSAGGWLARGLLAEKFASESVLFQNSSVVSAISGVVTLGTPHIPPDNINNDMTNGAWTSVHQLGLNDLINKNIKFITVAGLAVKASIRKDAGRAEEFAHQSYKTVRGQLINNDDFIGDGVTPLSAAHLANALKLNISEAYHGVKAPNNLWYGGERIVDKWLLPSLQHLGS
jgi:hypothetical protein